MAQLRYWVWLTTLEGVTSVTIRRLMDRFGEISKLAARKEEPEEKD